MLSGVIAYVKGNKITGTIPSKGAQTFTPGTANQTIAAGQYLSGVQTIVGSANFKEENIKEGVNIWGKVGTLKPRFDIDSYALYLYRNSNAINGNMVENSVTNIVKTSLLFRISSGNLNFSSDNYFYIGQQNLTNGEIAMNKVKTFTSNAFVVVFNPDKIPISINSAGQFNVTTLID